MAECGEGAPDGRRDFGVGHGEAADVQFVHDLAVPLEGGAVGDGKGRRGSDDRLGHQCGGVVRARAVAIEQQRVQPERPVYFGGPRVQ